MTLDPPPGAGSGRNNPEWALFQMHFPLFPNAGSRGGPSHPGRGKAAPGRAAPAVEEHDPVDMAPVGLSGALSYLYN